MRIASLPAAVRSTTLNQLMNTFEGRFTDVTRVNLDRMQQNLEHFAQTVMKAPPKIEDMTGMTPSVRARVRAARPPPSDAVFGDAEGSSTVDDIMNTLRRSTRKAARAATDAIKAASMSVRRGATQSSRMQDAGDVPAPSAFQKAFQINPAAGLARAGAAGSSFQTPAASRFAPSHFAGAGAPSSAAAAAAATGAAVATGTAGEAAEGVRTTRAKAAATGAVVAAPGEAAGEAAGNARKKGRGAGSGKGASGEAEVDLAAASLDAAVAAAMRDGEAENKSGNPAPTLIATAGKASGVFSEVFNAALASDAPRRPVIGAAAAGAAGKRAAPLRRAATAGNK